MSDVNITLPDWVREGAKHLTAPIFSHWKGTTLEGNQISFIDLINDERLISVWRSIDKAKWIFENDDYKSQSKLDVVLSGIRFGLLPLMAWDEISTIKRTAKAKRVRALCEKLEQEFEPYVDNGKSLRPPSSELYGYGSLSYLTADLTAEFAEATMRLLPESDLAKTFTNASSEESFLYDEMIRSALWYGINRIPDILDAFCSGLEQHAEYKPEVYRPGDSGAKRKIFAQRVTKMFEKNFGRPFREETWVLTSIFFEVGELDSSYLSKIAKSKKPARK